MYYPNRVPKRTYTIGFPYYERAVANNALYISEKNADMNTAIPVLRTDAVVNCYDQEIADYKEIRGYEIERKVYVYLDDIAELLAKSYEWSEEDKTLRFTAVFLWDFVVVNPNHDWDLHEVNEGLAFLIRNKSSDDEIIFEIEEYVGEVGAIPSIRLSHASISFCFMQHITTWGDAFLKSWSGLDFFRNQRITDDTQERRDELSKTIRVYINGEQIGGVIGNDGINPNSDYYFRFDRLYDFSEIETIRLEVGTVRME